MKTVVIYATKTGFTKKYALWIHEALGGDLFRKNEVSVDQLLNYDVIVYGGNLHAVGISGIDLIRSNLDKLNGKKIYVFATGASPNTQAVIDDITKNNFSEDELKKISFYYMRGGFDYRKLPLTDKFLMRLLQLKIQMKKKSKRSPDEVGMLAIFNKKTDYTKKEYINELVESVKSIL